MLVQHSKPAVLVILIYLSALVIISAAGWQKSAAGALDVLMIALGSVFLIKPHLGNFSRSLGLVLIGLGGFDIPRGLFLIESRGEFVFLSTMLAAGFVLYGIECLRQGRLSVRLLGGTFVVLGLAIHAAGVWVFSPLAGTRPPGY